MMNTQYFQPSDKRNENIKFPINTSKPELPKLYPNCDGSIWLRSCEKEIIEPLNGTVTGIIPKWLNGSLLRNGPGSLKVGEMKFNHLFDSSALVHRFAINNGRVTYQCRFLQTETFKKNKAANRIVVTEFGTCAVPDPCHNIFQRVSAIFKPNDMSDNAMISIYPFGDEYFAFTECPIIHKINPENLSTEKRLCVTDYVGIVSHTSHPHVMPDGTVYNLGMTITPTGPYYNIVCFPKGDSMFDDAYVVGAIPSRWKFYPAYMHTFSVTKNYFVIVEQPLSLSIPEMMKGLVVNNPMAANFKWFTKNTCIYLVNRLTGKLDHTFQADPFFYLHIINSYESDDHLILDICCYKDASMLDCMYIESIENMQYNPNYANMFRGRPLRFVCPIKETLIKHPTGLIRSLSINNLMNRLVSSKLPMKRSESMQSEIYCETKAEKNISTKKEMLSKNLINLCGTKAEAYFLNHSTIFCKPEILCDLGCETPRISYELHNGKYYQYFYAISSDVDSSNPGTLIKVDVKSKTAKTWCEENCYPSEPIFVSSPNSKDEDDGVVIASMVWGKDDENRVGLLVLCAKSWTEIGRCEFETMGPVPKCLHGWFVQD